MSKHKYYSATGAPDSNLSPLDALVLEIIKHCGEVEERNLVELTGNLIGHFGSPERATAALRSGDAGVEWISDSLN